MAPNAVGPNPPSNNKLLVKPGEFRENFDVSKFVADLVLGSDSGSVKVFAQVEAATAAASSRASLLQVELQLAQLSR